MDRVEAGGRATVTRDGGAVAELLPVRPRGLSAATLLEHWRRLPAVDPTSIVSTTCNPDDFAGIDGLTLRPVTVPDLR